MSEKPEMMGFMLQSDLPQFLVDDQRKKAKEANPELTEEELEKKFPTTNKTMEDLEKKYPSHIDGKPVMY